MGARGAAWSTYVAMAGTVLGICAGVAALASGLDITVPCMLQLKHHSESN